MRNLSLTLLALSSCATTTVSVAPGHAAILLSDDGALSQLGEGVSEVPASAQADDFDLRQQIQGGSFSLLTADGVPLYARDPIVTFRIVSSELVAADRRTGPGGWRALVTPIVHATLSSVLAGYRWAELTPEHIREAQARITRLAAERLRPLHVELSSVELKGLTPSLPALARAVTDTAVWEQRSLEAKAHIELARQTAESLRAQAQGIAAANRSIGPTLEKGVLADKTNQAWQRLITSPRTTVQITSQPSPTLEVSP